MTRDVPSVEKVYPSGDGIVSNTSDCAMPEEFLNSASMLTNSLGVAVDSFSEAIRIREFDTLPPPDTEIVSTLELSTGWYSWVTIEAGGTAK